LKRRVWCLEEWAAACCFTNILGRRWSGEEDTYSEEDFERTDERDHHGREEEGVGTIDMDREGVNR
jgi:hypothetical protein